jgi:hypothetical protein
MPTVYSAVFIGAGPAGTGPLLCALGQGRFSELLDLGVAWVDRCDHMLESTLGKYIIRSDTMGSTFLECLQGPAASTLRDVVDSEPARAIRARQDGPVPLRMVGRYLRRLGRSLETLVQDHPTSRFFSRTRALRVRRLAEDLFATDIQIESNTSGPYHRSLLSRTVVVATGGQPAVSNGADGHVVGGIPLAQYQSKIVPSDWALTAGGLREMRMRLDGVHSVSAVILGGSHSAFSTAWTLLNRLDGVRFDKGSVTIVHRRKPKLFYGSAESALADGYRDFDAGDICPLTGRVHRLGGLRFDARELLRRAWGMSESDTERRVTLRQIEHNHDDRAGLEALLDDAALIVPALGYRPKAIQVIGSDGLPLSLQCETGGPLVDRACRVLAGDGTPIPGLLALGLGSGFVPSGPLGGEPNFSGQTNGLWLYQHGVGEIVLNTIVGRAA